MMPEAFKGSSARADDAADAARYCEEAIESMSGFGPHPDIRHSAEGMVRPDGPSELVGRQLAVKGPFTCCASVRCMMPGNRAAVSRPVVLRFRRDCGHAASSPI